MKYVNAIAVVAVLFAGSVGSAQEQKRVNKGKTTVEQWVAEQEEQALINISNICGENLACYFNPAELAQAFGGRMGLDAGLADLFAGNESDKYAAEDASVYQEVMMAEARAKQRKEWAQAQKAAKKIADQATKDVAPVKVVEAPVEQNNKVELAPGPTRKEIKDAVEGDGKLLAELKQKRIAEEKIDAEKKRKALENTPLKFVGIQGRGYPIYASFVRNFRQCAPGCFPKVVSVNRPGAYSCHNGGRAIDVGGIVCGGKTYEAFAEANYSGKFVAMKDCMKPKMKTLWHNQAYVPGPKGTKTSGHWDHAHFSNGCTLADGTRFF